MTNRYFRYIFTLMSVFVAGFACMASDVTEALSQTKIVRKDSLSSRPLENEMVIVGGDTVPLVIPEKNYGRFDRGLYNYLYIPKKAWDFGLTASYGSFSTDDVQLLSVLKNIDFSGKIYSIKPSVSYFFRNNQSIGFRFNYTLGMVDLDNLKMDFDEDMNFELHNVSYHTHSCNFGVFYRNYVGLGRASRFAVFNEVSLEVGLGSTRFKRYYDEVLYNTHSSNTSAKLSFSPGLCVFIQENAAFNVSFGVFGLHLTNEHQYTNGEDEGSRFSSGANFRFNIFNINFGLMVVI